MPRPANELASELRAIMRERKGQPLSLTWAIFYNMCDRQKWTEKAELETKEAALEVGLILGFGVNVVTVAQDEDFAPLGS